MCLNEIGKVRNARRKGSDEKEQRKGLTVEIENLYHNNGIELVCSPGSVKKAGSTDATISSLADSRTSPFFLVS